jgi:hypothetical protein
MTNEKAASAVFVIRSFEFVSSFVIRVSSFSL